MAKKRMINTKIWDDTYFTELKVNEKLVFIYLLTNTLTNLSGIYEIQVKRISYDTGIGISDINKVLDKFKNDNKIYLYEGFIMIKNFIKNQSLNPSIEKGIKRELKSIPQNILCTFFALNKDNLTDYIEDVPSLSPACPQPVLLNLTKPNLTKPNLNLTLTTSEQEFQEDLFLSIKDNDIKEIINEWIEYRKEKKKSLKNKVIQSLIKTSKEYTKQDFISCIRASINNDWLGLFFDKYKKIEIIDSSKYTKQQLVKMYIDSKGVIIEQIREQNYILAGEVEILADMEGFYFG